MSSTLCMSGTSRIAAADSGTSPAIRLQTVRFFMRACGVHRLGDQSAANELIARMQLLVGRIFPASLKAAPGNALWEFRWRGMEVRITPGDVLSLQGLCVDDYREDVMPWPKWSRRVRILWMAAVLRGRITGFLPFGDGSFGPPASMIPEYLHTVKHAGPGIHTVPVRLRCGNAAGIRQPKAAINPEKFRASLDPSQCLLAAGFFNRFYPCSELSAREISLLYLAWLWNRGLIVEDKCGLMWVNEDAAEFDPRDYEFEIEGMDPFPVFDPERLLKEFRLGRLAAIMGWGRNAER